ncbi:MAG: MerR family transcriptional regulator [Candidatus Omnitrophica bacterium]|nr:MerR family transcriptional regulator [Candidatus Omnitrophota bacterium]MCM8802894.1 MerR family transcriptional regulator [Candidatus Omnitrophota bacterium]
MKIKFYYIRDASKLLDIPPHILRYWEKQLNLKIMRDRKGNRIYTDKDIEVLKNIKLLIYNDGLRIKGVKKKLKEKKLENKKECVKLLKKIFKKLKEIKKCLQ